LRSFRDGSFVFLTGLTRFTGCVILKTELPENKRGGTEAGESGLDELNADECGEEQPPGADKIDEGDRNQNHRSGKDTDSVFYSHGYSLS
jgi:hypothetical protein